MYKINGLALFLVVFFLFGCVTNNGTVYDVKKRHIEKDGGYSICPPELWQAEEIGQKYKGLFGSSALYIVFVAGTLKNREIRQ
jgi:hypothetical protein